MKIIILAGGGGTRLFPLSRRSFPKQFLKIENEKSLLVHTIERFLPLVSAKDIIIVTNETYRYHVQSELAECHAEEAHILLEPVARNTAPAIALAVRFCMDKLSCMPDEAMVVAPADHVIRPIDVFKDCILQAESLVKSEVLVTFGIPASSPETGYGYIETEAAGAGLHVVSFTEKPNGETAQKYVDSGNYYWNSGMFAFTSAFMNREFHAYCPKISAVVDKGYDEAVKHFGEMPNISIDYAVAEHSKWVRMVPLTCYWNDIGSWDAVYDILPKDESGNAARGDILTQACKNSLLIGRDRLIAGIGLEDLLIVETNDVILVAKRGESQQVKQVVEHLKEQGRKEAVEHTTMYHAWGTSSVIGRGEGYRMKKVRVSPGQGITLQMHYHRSEHWVVLRGTASVVRGEETLVIHEGESVFIPQATKHQLTNPGRIPLEIIEVQNGAYIGEDDIVRFWT